MKAKVKKGRSKAARKTALERRRKRHEKFEEKGPPDPSQNLHVTKGAAVTLGEVRAEALPGCASCSGTGSTPRGVLCACATRRFIKAHPEIVVDRVGHSWWPAKTATKPAA